MISSILRTKIYSRGPLLLERLSLTRNISRVRYFQTSPIIAAKRKGKVEAKGKKSLKRQAEVEVEETEDEQPSIDFEKVESKLKNVIDKFSKHANEAKLGKINPNLFDKLTVQTTDGPAQFNTLAQTVIKGRFLAITVFDPSNSKNIVNAVLGSNLNMNPQIDPSDNQTLKVPLPSPTTESKKESVSNLKAVFEKFKTGTGKGSESLGTIRSDVRNSFKKSGKKKQISDSENSMLLAFDKLHSTYVQKLQDSLKAAEQAIMK